MRLLNDYIDTKDIHCIGHNLGAHVCGYIGQDTHRLYRITGLNPAGPLFYNDTTHLMPNYLENEPFGDADTHLSQDDAPFVDCYHTDGNYIYRKKHHRQKRGVEMQVSQWSCLVRRYISNTVWHLTIMWWRGHLSRTRFHVRLPDARLWKWAQRGWGWPELFRYEGCWVFHGHNWSQP